MHVLRLRPRNDVSYHLLNFEYLIDPLPTLYEDKLDAEGNTTVVPFDFACLRRFVLVVGIGAVEVGDYQVRYALVIDEVSAHPFDVGARRARDRSRDGQCLRPRRNSSEFRNHAVHFTLAQQAIVDQDARQLFSDRFKQQCCSYRGIDST